MVPSHNAIVAAPMGSRQWRTDTAGEINGSLSVAAAKVIADNFSGDVVALDVQSGRTLWTTKLDNVVMSTPIVIGREVIVGTGRNGGLGGVRGSFVYESGSATAAESLWGRSDGDHIVALDLATGAVLWKYRTAGEDMPSGPASRDNFVFSNGDAHAYAVSAQNGTPRWRTDLPGIATMASALPIRALIVVSTCDFSTGNVATLALRDATGSIAWRSKFGNCDSSPTFGEGTVFVSGVEGNRQAFGYGGKTVVAAIDARDGSTKWRYEGWPRPVQYEVAAEAL